MKKIALLNLSSTERFKPIQNHLSECNVELVHISSDDLSQLQSNQYDALVFAVDESEQIDEIKKIILNFHEDSSPIGVFFYAAFLISETLGEYGVALTIGKDAELAAKIEKSGAQHVECENDDFITDRQNKVVSTPMNVNSVGIQKSISELFEMA